MITTKHGGKMFKKSFKLSTALLITPLVLSISFSSCVRREKKKDLGGDEVTIQKENSLKTEKQEDGSYLAFSSGLKLQTEKLSVAEKRKIIEKCQLALEADNIIKLLEQEKAELTKLAETDNTVEAKIDQIQAEIESTQNEKSANLDSKVAVLAKIDKKEMLADLSTLKAKQPDQKISLGTPSKSTVELKSEGKILVSKISEIQPDSIQGEFNETEGDITLLTELPLSLICQSHELKKAKKDVSVTISLSK